ncbi:MAG TPA: hypothetical protein DCY59_11815, partial [Micrococcaceae bacterium]|nr:hypothetical protein [Micrococcaceae bacterium]
ATNHQATAAEAALVNEANVNHAEPVDLVAEDLAKREAATEYYDEADEPGEDAWDLTGRN